MNFQNAEDAGYALMQNVQNIEKSGNWTKTHGIDLWH